MIHIYTDWKFEKPVDGQWQKEWLTLSFVTPEPINVSFLVANWVWEHPDLHIFEQCANPCGISLYIFHYTSWLIGVLAMAQWPIIISI